eukprot:9382276-Alexandrium_andersonii.AAC.1
MIKEGAIAARRPRPARDAVAEIAPELEDALRLEHLGADVRGVSEARDLAQREQLLRHELLRIELLD